MNKTLLGIHAAVADYDLARFRGPAGPVAFIAPLANDVTVDGWVVIDMIGQANLADLAAVILDSETVVITSDASDYTAIAGDLALRNERIVLLEYDGDGPIPDEIAEAIIEKLNSK